MAETYKQRAIRYAREGASGKRVVGKLERLACERFLKDLRRAETLSASFVFRERHVNAACKFAEMLPHVEGSDWKGGGLLVLEDWQVFILANVFGFRKRDNEAQRRFDTSLVLVARKNGKSMLTAIIALYCLTMEGEVGPKIYNAATTGDQARIVFDVAKRMVERNEPLRTGLHLEALANSIYCSANNGSIRPINSKASTQDGLNPHLATIDELHAHKDRALFDVLRSARGARKNPLTWLISTAGYEIEGVCFEQRDLAIKILQGIIEADHYFAAIYEIDPEDDIFDRTVWPKANPNLGVSVQESELENYAKESAVSPQTAGEFATKRLNRWISANNAWLSIPQWDSCSDPTLVPENMIGYPLHIGVDLSAKDDIASVALVWLKDGMVYAITRNYLPKEVVMRDAQRKAHYVAWAGQGHLILTDGDLIDYDHIESDIRALAAKHDVRSITFDPYQAVQMVSRLSNDGLPAQTISMTVATMSDPSKELEARIKTGKFRHDGNPVFRWAASNVTVRRDRKENIYPQKDRPNSQSKIDPIIATIIALGQALRELPGPSMVSAYENRPLLVL